MHVVNDKAIQRIMIATLHWYVVGKIMYSGRYVTTSILYTSLVIAFKIRVAFNVSLHVNVAVYTCLYPLLPIFQRQVRTGANGGN